MLGKRKPPAGAPEWALTYGDMMSLLLCFFILLAAFADYERGASVNMIVAMQSIQRALGIRVPQANVDSIKVDFNTLIEKLQEMVKMQNDRFRGDTTVPGIQGESLRLRRIRDGLELTLGGPVIFQPFSDRLTPEGEAALREIAASLRGHRNKLEIRGHAADQPLPADWTDRDIWRLSYARAEHVAAELVRQGVNPRAIRLAAAGASEPVDGAMAGSTRNSDNRRVEIFIRESLLDDYVGQKPLSSNDPLDTRPPAGESGGTGQ